MVMSIIADTYTDDDKCDAYLALALFDAATIENNKAAQAINARDKINTFLGRTVSFTVTELVQTQFAGIVDAASQLTACLLEANPQAAAMKYTEDTIIDCAEAYRTLRNWALKNGVETPENATKQSHTQTELIYQYNNPNEVI
jgi:hypothetical protein